MSRSRHGHKHVGRSKCWVCRGLDRPRKDREADHGARDRADGEQEHAEEREDLE